MARLSELAEQLRAEEETLVAGYKELERAANSDVGRRLVMQAARYQEFQLRCLELLSGPLPERFAGFGSITQDSVNLRSGPGGQHDLIGELDRGEQVILQGHQGFWVHIQVVGGDSGWVFRDYVQADDPGGLSEGALPAVPLGE